MSFRSTLLSLFSNCVFLCLVVWMCERETHTEGETETGTETERELRQ